MATVFLFYALLKKTPVADFETEIFAAQGER
jgi:hypothetical protein